MSLFIVGSCSRITRNIILSGAAHYKKVTICDLLPTYDQHYRFYNFKKELAEQRSPIDISISKLTQYEDIYNGINAHDDALYVTHDYFNAVISKTKLMKLVAEFGKKVALCLCRKAICTLPLQLSTTTLGLQTLRKTTSRPRRKCRRSTPTQPSSGRTFKTATSCTPTSTNPRRYGRKSCWKCLSLSGPMWSIHPSTPKR